MGSAYAGILGSVAFATVVIRGCVNGSDIVATMKAASLCLFAFALAGYAVGQIADSVVTKGVERKFLAKLENYHLAFWAISGEKAFTQWAANRMALALA